MIISHSHRFCFIKTRKTAGTSIEVALAPLLSADDWISPLEELGASGNIQARPFTRELRKRIDGVRPRNPHLPVSIIDDYFANDTEDYFRFCVERNPWDKAVSAFFWLTKRRGPYKGDTVQEQFLRFAAGPRLASFSDFDMYSADGEVSVNAVLQFDNLREELCDLADKGLIPKIDIQHTRMKSTQRPESSRKLHDFYGDGFDNEASFLVRHTFSREIGHFGYRPFCDMPIPPDAQA